MRLTTWNVNGIRNPFAYPPWNTTDRSFPAMFDLLGPSDIIVMQELKIQRKDLRDDMVLIDGWDCYFSLPKHKKGYSGVGIYCRTSVCAPVKAEEGLLGVLPSPGAGGLAYRDLHGDRSIGGYPTEAQLEELGVDAQLLDAEGRCVIVEFPAFVLLGVYSPANSNGLRDDFRYGFICALDCRIRNLIKMGKRVILCGDLNVSRDELDGASALDDMRKAGLTHEDYISTPNRRIFNQLLVGGEVADSRDEGREEGVLWDTTRGFHEGRKGMYTHWEQKINARPGNFGSRIDFILTSAVGSCDMRSWIQDANIQEGLLGSDHCPVYIEFHDKVTVHRSKGADEETHIIDIMNAEGLVSNGKRLRVWKVSDAPAFSAKKMPEFDKRRSIKNMFAVPSKNREPSQNTSSTKDSKPDKGNSSAGETAIREEQSASSTSAADMKENGSSQTLDSLTESRYSSSDTSPAHKRKLSTSLNGTALKRQKSENVQTKAAKGQQSMRSFFQPKASPSKEARNGAIKLSQDASPAMIPSSQTQPSNYETPEPPSPSRDAVSQPSPSASPEIDTDAALAANEATQRSWSSLFSRPIAPLCEGHNEPCKTMQTKKKGSNQGRSFWMCARPLGPSGNKEKETQWRCPTFIWCSDWGGKASGNVARQGDKDAPVD